MTESVGTVTITRKWDQALDRYTIRIDRADQRAAISGELMRLIDEGGMGDHMTHALGVLTLTDDYGQRFDYNLGDYDPASDTYPMARR